MARNTDPQPQSTRRDFLWKNACAALTLTGIATTVRDLRLINAAAADNIRAAAKPKASGGSIKPATSSSNYKALVCIFLFGGNDGNNLLVPTDTATFTRYAAARGVLALSQPGTSGGPLALNPLSNDGHTYGINPAMPEIQTLFNSGQAALLANVGTLLAPLTRTQYLNQSVATPAQLFSHNDQQVEWQTSSEDETIPTGWGGRTADLLYSLNTSNTVSMNISLAGSNTFQTGNTVNAYSVSENGAIALVNAAPQQAVLQNLLNMSHPNLYEGAFAQQMNTAISDAGLLNAAIAPTAASNYWTTPFPITDIGFQLKMIARLIQAAPTFGHNRQIFFASMGGFDLHGGEGTANGAQYNLLQQLSEAMNALYQATEQIGVSASVTQFTASDFSRTLPANSSLGADHGWGSHHIILGGSVVGQNIYGTYPTLQVNGPDDTSTGRWIPTTAVDQYAATLAKWFGVSATNMTTVLPYIGRFATADLGFMG